MKIKKSQLKPGRWVRVMFDDVGARDCILIEVDRYARVFEPYEGTHSVQMEQIVAIGAQVQCKNSGL